MERLLRAAITATLVLGALGAAVPDAASAAPLPTGSITGTVTGAGGASVEHTMLVPSLVGGGQAESDFVDPDGSYTLSGLPPGDYVILVLPPPFHSVRQVPGSMLLSAYYGGATYETATRVHVTAGATTAGIDIHLVLGGTVRGRVIGTDGTPVVNQSVDSLPPNPEDWVLSAATGPDGTFELGPLRDAEYVLELPLRTGEVLQPGAPRVVQGKQGEAVPIADSVIAWNGLITGHARDADGAPVQNADILLTTPENPAAIRAHAVSRGPDGSYQLRGFGRSSSWRVSTVATVNANGVSPGSWWSSVPSYWSPQGSTETPGPNDQFSTRADNILTGKDILVRRTGLQVAALTPTVIADLDVSGAAITLAATGGAGIPTGTIQASSSGSPQPAPARLDATGRLRQRVDLVPPFAHTIRIAYSGDATYAPSEMTVRDTDYLPYAPGPGVIPLEQPQRLFDGTVAPGQPSCIGAAGALTLPADATGVMVNVTAVRPAGAGYAVVYPSAGAAGSSQPTPIPPNGATVNFEPDREVSNAAFVKVGADGKLCVGSPSGAASSRIVIDVSGYVSAASGLTLQSHERILDTRATGSVRPRVLTTVQVAGKGGVPTGATAVLLNVAATGVRSVGNLRLQPGAAGDAVTTHYAPGADKSVATIATLSPTGSLTMWSDTATDVDVVLDVVGWVSGTSVYRPITPTRVLDSRPGAPAAVRKLAGPLAAGTVHSLPVRGVGPVPANAVGVMLSVTAIGPRDVGNLSIYPDSEGTGLTPRPNASNINYVPGRNIPNLVTVGLPANGRVNLVSQMVGNGTVDVAIEVIGYLTG